MGNADVLVRVARALKARREALGLSLRAASERSGVSVSMISEVERAAKSPTVTTLAALAGALGVPVSALVEPPPARRIRAVRAADRRAGGTRGAGRDRYRPPIASSRIELVRYTVPPGRRAGPFAAHDNGVIEHIWLMSGRMTLCVGDEAENLRAGDCCSCFVDAPHAFDNRSSRTEATVFLVMERP
jgi:transcriptional regulator with XRE-family HTH domain